ncbi:MAG: hypothetical protein AAGJ40_22045 [Planctomycetota bacterium]
MYLAEITAAVDVGPLITEAMTVLYGVVAIAVTAAFSLLLVRRGMRWAGWGSK